MVEEGEEREKLESERYGERERTECHRGRGP